MVNQSLATLFAAIHAPGCAGSYNIHQDTQSLLIMRQTISHPKKLHVLMPVTLHIILLTAT